MTTNNKPPIISSPHMHAARSVGQVMRQVIYALIPGILLSAWVFGSGVIIQCLLAILIALLTEALMLKLIDKPVRFFLSDNTAIVTALLYALALSPFAPWWVNLAGIAFAIIFAKHCFGGTGQNLFNPAMAGYVFVLICFPVHLNYWPMPAGTAETSASLIDTLKIIFIGKSSVANFDAMSGATTLSYLKSQINAMTMVSEIRMSPLFGSFAGKGSEWVACLWFAGGIWLLIQKIIKWQMPVIFLGTMFLLSLGFYWYDDSVFTSPLLALFSGGFMIAAFFIITDPVSSPSTPKGKIIYAAGIAIITFLIRNWGSYPEGVAFAVLCMNAAVPLIDITTRPRIFGEST